MKLHQLWRISLWLSIFQLSVFLLFWLERVFPSLVIVFFRASRKMPRSPRLAHKAPVMQARITLTVFGLLCLIATLWSGKTMVSVLQANLIGCRVGFVLSSFFKSKFSCPLLWRERYSRPFHWALTLSINTRVVDRAAIESNRRVKSEVGS